MTELEEAEARAALVGVTLKSDQVAADYLSAVRAMDLHVGKLPRNLPVDLEPATKLGLA